MSHENNKKILGLALICENICANVFVHGCVCVCVCVCMHMPICVFVCACLGVCVPVQV